MTRHQKDRRARIALYEWYLSGVSVNALAEERGCSTVRIYQIMNKVKVRDLEQTTPEEWNAYQHG